MKKQLIFTLSFLFVWSACAMAESNLIDIPEAELLDAYLEDQPTQSRKPLTAPEGPSTQVKSEEAVKFRKVQDSNGVQVYEVIPAEPDSAALTDTSIPEAAVSTDQPELAATSEAEVQNNEELEIIELDSYNEEIIEVEAPTSEDAKVAAYVNKHDHIYCQQNPFVKECLYAPYLSRCERDPQSSKCHAQLEQFESFCETFPRSYKCKKAHLAATCKQQPKLDECKPFTERYCQKYPKAVFCDWN